MLLRLGSRCRRPYDRSLSAWERLAVAHDLRDRPDARRPGRAVPVRSFCICGGKALAGVLLGASPMPSIIGWGVAYDPRRQRELDGKAV